MFAWLKKRKKKKRLDKLTWKTGIYRATQTRLLQVKRIMEAEGDVANARKIQAALLTTIVACNRNSKGLKVEAEAKDES